mgnify:CR=1 FL=1
MNVLSTILSDKKVTCFKDIYEAVNRCSNGEKGLIPNIIHLLKLLLVNPATSCTPERSFSTARRLKTWLRSTMKSKRFNALALLNIHKELKDKVDLMEVGNEFIALSEQRYNYFGKFKASDFKR